MRKILAAFLLIAITATSSFATSATDVATGVPADSGMSIFPANAATEEGPAVGKMSTGVYIAWATLTTSYVIKTQHISGVRTFATASDSTAINWKPSVVVNGTGKGSDIPAPDAAATNDTLIAEGGWSVM